MNGKNAFFITAFTIGGAAALYRVYNLWSYRHWADKKRNQYKKSSEDAQYQMFLAERREKRYFLWMTVEFVFRWSYFKFALYMIGAYMCGYVAGLLDQDDQELYPEAVDKNTIQETTL